MRGRVRIYNFLNIFFNFFYVKYYSIVHTHVIFFVDNYLSMS